MSRVNLITKNQQVSAISRLFSPMLIRELAKKGQSSLFARLANDSCIEFDPHEPIRNFFNRAFRILQKKNYRHEYIYKSAITHKILLGKHSLKTAVLLNEFRVCNNKADTVIINGTSTVYEIKSERDTLARLKQQISSYRKIFANVNIITGENHINSVLESVPYDVGVMLLNNRCQISTIRESIDSVNNIESEAIFYSIQVQEAKKILKNNGYEIPKLPNTKIFKALKERFITLKPEDAHSGMVNVLKSTRCHLSLCNLINSLPKSLQAVALSTSLRKHDHLKLVNAVNTSMSQAMQWK